MRRIPIPQVRSRMLKKFRTKIVKIPIVRSKEYLTDEIIRFFHVISFLIIFMA